MDNHRDVVLYVCGQAFVANRIAVSAASPYLGSVLAAAPSSTHVTLPPLVPPDVFSALMAGVGDMASLRRALTETNVEQVMNTRSLLDLKCQRSMFCVNDEKYLYLARYCSYLY